MNIAVVSDSHDNIYAIRDFVNLVNKLDVNLVLHCGDFVSPFAVNEFRKLNTDFIGVFGNNDGEIFGLLKASDFSIFKPPYELDIDGKSIVMMHEPLFVDEVAASKKFKVILYGHTHRVDVRNINGSIIVNPGELCGYLTNKRTFAIIDTDKMVVDLREL